MTYFFRSTDAASSCNSIPNLLHRAEGPRVQRLRSCCCPKTSCKLAPPLSPLPQRSSEHLQTIFERKMLTSTMVHQLVTSPQRMLEAQIHPTTRVQKFRADAQPWRQCSDHYVLKAETIVCIISLSRIKIVALWPLIAILGCIPHNSGCSRAPPHVQ